MAKDKKEKSKAQSQVRVEPREEKPKKSHRESDYVGHPKFAKFKSEKGSN